MHKFLFVWLHCGKFIKEELPKFVDIHAGMAGDEQRWFFRAQKSLPCDLICASDRLLAFISLGHHGEYIHPLSPDVCDQFYVEGLGREP